MTLSIQDALASVTSRIRAAETAAARPSGSVRLLAVSKTFPAEAVREAYACGQRAFGENYVQELAGKAAALADLPGLEWHFIGPLQSNKTRPVAERAHWVHAVDRLKIAERLNEQRPESAQPLQVCIQVNISGESQKSGTTEAEVLHLAEQIAQFPRLKLRGLMAIAENTPDDAVLRQSFLRLKQIFSTLQQQFPSMDTLSMGMTHDLEVAVACGSSQVRIGTAIFGARDDRQD